MSLRGKTVVVTRAQHQAQEMVQIFQQLGAKVIEFPLLEMRLIQGTDYQQTVNYLKQLHNYQATMVTSRNAVTFLMNIFTKENFQSKILITQPMFAIGEKTQQALQALDIPSIVSQHTTSADLYQTIFDHCQPLGGKKMLVFRAKEGLDVLANLLREQGVVIDIAYLYETIPLESGLGLPNVSIDWITFASPTAVAAFCKRSKLPPRVKVACIGPTTANKAHELDIPVDIVAKVATVTDLALAMGAFETS